MTLGKIWTYGLRKRTISFGSSLNSRKGYNFRLETFQWTNYRSLQHISSETNSAGKAALMNDSQ